MIPDIFTLTPDIVNIGESAINSLIHNFGKKCQCVYDSPSQTVCNNCYFNSVTGQSSGRYNGSGPRPFTTGVCPVCHGSGFIPGQQNTSIEVLLLINWQPKVNTLITDKTVRIPGDIVHIKGFVADEASVAQAKYIVLDYLQNHFNGNKYVLYSGIIEPGNIIRNRYFEAFLQKYIN